MRSPRDVARIGSPRQKILRTRFREPGEIRFHQRWSAGNDVDAPKCQTWQTVRGLRIPRDVSSPRNKSEERVFWCAQATAREASSSSSSYPTPSCRSAATTVRGGPRRRTPRSSASPRVGPESWVSSPRTSRPIRRTSWLRRCVSARSHAPVGFETGVTTRRLPRSLALVRGPNRARPTFDASRRRRADADLPDANPNPDSPLPV